MEAPLPPKPVPWVIIAIMSCMLTPIFSKDFLSTNSDSSAFFSLSCNSAAAAAIPSHFPNPPAPQTETFQTSSNLPKKYPLPTFPQVIPSHPKSSQLQLLPGLHLRSDDGRNGFLFLLQVLLVTSALLPQPRGLGPRLVPFRGHGLDLLHLLLSFQGLKGFNWKHRVAKDTKKYQYLKLGKKVVSIQNSGFPAIRQPGIKRSKSWLDKDDLGIT